MQNGAVTIMNLSRQVLLGSGVCLGGGILLFAMVKQITASPNPDTAKVEANKIVTAQVASSPTTAPLTADIETEQRILAERQKEREARVAQQEREAQQYINEQQRVESAALAKTRAENQQYATKNQPTTSPISNAPLENSSTNTIEAPANPTSTAPEVATVNAPKPNLNTPTQAMTAVQKAQRQAEIKLEAQRVAQQKVQEAAQQKLAREQQQKEQQEQRRLQQQELKLQQEEKRLQQQQLREQQKEAQRQQKIQQEQLKAQQLQQQKEDYKLAQQKLREARQAAKDNDAQGSFGVQVALAADDKRAEELVQKLQAAGYNVKTSKTSRGTRVVVGPEKGKIAALALKDKINRDPKVQTNNAWVLFW